MKEPKNEAMKLVELLRKKEKISKSEMARMLSSRTRYYEHMEADDIKLGILKSYMNRLGYDLIARNRETGFEKKL